MNKNAFRYGKAIAEWRWGGSKKGKEKLKGGKVGYDSSIYIRKKDIPLIKQTLLNNGFELCDDRRNGFYLMAFHKYVDDNFKYFEGVSFCILESKRKYYVCGRNYVSCSSYDLDLHNKTLLLLSSTLSRSFHTDEGENKLFSLFKSPSGVTNALAFPFSSLHNLFENLYFYLSKVEPLSDSQKSLNELLGGSSILNQESFSINLLNIYLVSVLETYFKRTFVNLLKCLNPVAFVSIRNSTNIPRYAQAEYISGQIDEYQMVAAGYSFQKINNIVNTYNNCFSVDLMVVLSKRADRNKTKYQIFEELFASRHGNVHKLEYNYSKLKDFIKKASIIAKSLNQIYGYLCKCYNVKRVEDYLYRTDFENNMKMIKTNHSSEVLR